LIRELYCKFIFGYAEVSQASVFILAGARRKAMRFQAIYIEDNRNNQILVQKILERLEVEVLCYDEPEIGYQAILDLKPDLILLDIHLKRYVTGLDVALRLRRQGVTTPIIVLTAFGGMGDRTTALAKGCNAYLMKPFTLEQLLSVVEPYLPVYP
jgi:CheY-like chemotaxis protein